MSLSFGGMSDAGPKEALAGTLWWGFGEAPPSAVTTAEVTLRELRRALGEPPAPSASAQPAHASPPPAHVEAPVLTALARYADVVDDSALRLAFAAGSAYPDVVRRRRGDAVATPDLVLRPHDAESVAGLVAACAEHDVALVPRGGGTSLSGGVDADDRGDCATLAVLDLRQLSRVLDVDPVSRRGDRRARHLGPRSWTPPCAASGSRSRTGPRASRARPSVAGSRRARSARCSAARTLRRPSA